MKEDYLEAVKEEKVYLFEMVIDRLNTLIEENSKLSQMAYFKSMKIANTGSTVSYSEYKEVIEEYSIIGRLDAIGNKIVRINETLYTVVEDLDRAIK